MVELTVFGTVTGKEAKATGEEAKLRIVLDRTPLDDPQEFPYFLVNSNITEYLRFDLPPVGNLHRIVFQPVDLDPESERAVIELVVLVRNPGS